MSNMLIAICIVTHGPEVLLKKITLGAFLASIRILQGTIEDCLAAYEDLMECVVTVAPLKTLTWLLNAEIDQLHKKSVADSCQDQTESKYVECLIDTRTESL